MTPAGIDVLKRRLGEFYSESSGARSLVGKVNEAVRGVLDKVPGYSEMVKDYETATKMIQEMESELSLGKNKSTGTAVRKLVNIFNQSNDYRQTMMEALEKHSGKELSQQLAGMRMASWTPTGIMRPLSGMGLLATATGISTGAVNPSALAAFLATSPRIVGETARLTGKAADVASKASKAAPLKAPFYRPASLAAQEYDFDPQTNQLVPRQ
jgi:hypothetical protein